MCRKSRVFGRGSGKPESGRDAPCGRLLKPGAASHLPRLEAYKLLPSNLDLLRRAKPTTSLATIWTRFQIDVDASHRTTTL
jgi:hypothetical protein